MINKSDQLQKYFNAIEEQNWKEIDSILDKDFTLFNQDGSQLNKKKYVKYLKKNGKQFKKFGFKHETSNFQESGGECRCDVKFRYTNLDMEQGSFSLESDGVEKEVRQDPNFVHIAVFKEDRISKLTITME